MRLLREELLAMYTVLLIVCLYSTESRPETKNLSTRKRNSGADCSAAPETMFSQYHVTSQNYQPINNCHRKKKHRKLKMLTIHYPPAHRKRQNTDPTTSNCVKKHF